RPPVELHLHADAERREGIHDREEELISRSSIVDRAVDCRRSLRGAGLGPPCGGFLVRLRHHHPPPRRLPAADAAPGSIAGEVLERDVADRGLVAGERLLAGAIAAPVAEREAAAALEEGGELLERVDDLRAGLLELPRLLEEALLERRERRG